MASFSWLLFTIILLEGYVVLASELLAIRQLVPFVGSGTEVVAIIISAVLLPLAVGYHHGGAAYRRQYRAARASGKKPLSVRRLLLKNVLSAMFVLAFGLSYPFLELFFGSLAQMSITHRVAQAFCYAVLFLVFPVYLLGQTVPLVSHYFSRARLSEITGKMLFFSTAGSFLGAVFSTLVLMMWLGVHTTVTVTLGLLFALTLLLSKRRLCSEVALALAAFGMAAFMNSGEVMRAFGIVSNNAYNTVAIEEIPAQEARRMVINRSASSKISLKPEHRFPYVRYIEDHYLRYLAEGPPREILVVGAGGFTLGWEDAKNHYTFVDIDPALKRVSEEDFLKERISENKRFVPMSARAFVRSDTGAYDLIVLDAYTNVISLPMECTTREFLEDVKARLKPGGIVIANVIGSPVFADRFTVRYDNTFAAVFPVFSRVTMDPYDPWAEKPRDLNNLYIYTHRQGVDDAGIYTDDRNTYSLDR